ncbi:hypothetical protein GCM10009801_02470 [Streptomyces albiaxialis]|uniref:Flp pilus assembly protein RcpC/CpaB domain-containing protein n=1 Tax=Streptomyces albiaxialis TaxID=329523 RepID=A0ABN2VFF6_9ACTN
MRAGRGGIRLRRLMRRRRRLVALGLAVAAAAMAASPPTRGAPRSDEQEPPERARGPRVTKVTAPVRIADAETVRLLRPGDRIDVLASGSASGPARVVARSVRVADVPKSGDTVSGDGAEGALIVVTVPRRTASALAGAAAASRLAVTLC